MEIVPKGFSGQFTLTGLTPGVDYRLAVTSVGEKGIRSPPAPLIAATLSRLSSNANKRNIFWKFS